MIRTLAALAIAVTVSMACTGMDYDRYDRRELRPIEQIPGAMDVRVEKQRGKRDCCVATIKTALDILDNDGDTRTSVLALQSSQRDDYETIQTDLAKEQGGEGYTSTAAIESYFRNHTRWRLRRIEGSDDIVEKIADVIRDDGKPVLVSLMMTPFDMGTQIPLVVGVFPFQLLDLPIRLLSLDHVSVVRLMTDGDEAIYRWYPHSALVLGVYHTGNPEQRVVLLADSWDGITALSAPSPGLYAMSEDEFVSRWAWEETDVDRKWKEYGEPATAYKFVR